MTRPFKKSFRLGASGGPVAGRSPFLLSSRTSRRGSSGLAPTNKIRILAVGNSYMVGDGAGGDTGTYSPYNPLTGTPRTTGFDRILARLPVPFGSTWDATYEASMNAVDGQALRIADPNGTLALFPTAVAPYCNSTKLNLIIYANASGDIRTAGQTGAQVYASLQTLAGYCHAITSPGPTRIAMIGPTWQYSVPTQAFYDTEIVALDNLLLADSSFLDGWGRTHGDPNIGVAGSAPGVGYNTNLNYWAENNGIHMAPSTYGSGRWADYGSGPVNAVVSDYVYGKSSPATLRPYTRANTVQHWMADRGLLDAVNGGLVTNIKWDGANVVNNDGAGVTAWASQLPGTRRDTNGLLIYQQQPTAGSRPTWKEGGPDNMPYVHFDSTDDFLGYLANWAATLAQPFTIWMVVRQPAVGAAAVHDCWLSFNGNSRGVLQDVTNLFRWTGNAAISAGQLVANNAWAVVGINFNNGGTSWLRVNGVQVATGVTGTEGMFRLVMNGTDSGGRVAGIDLSQMWITADTPAGATLTADEGHFHKYYPSLI